MSKIPAILVRDAASDLKIAGLTVLDRLVVTAQRAGCEPIVIGFSAPENQPALKITGSVLVEPRDLERVIAQRGRLISAGGARLPVEMTTLDPPPVVAEGIAMLINDEASAGEAERKLWASLSSTSDGLVDRFFNRPLGRNLSKILIHTPVSPNQVSICSSLIGLAAAWYFARGQFLPGAILLQISAIVDCVDGDMARMLLKESTLGKWLDLVGDQVVHFSVFAAIGIGVARTNPETPALLLGASAALGVILSFAVIVRVMKQSSNRRDSRLGALIDATTNRDFSILLLALSLIGRLDLFLWLAGIGVHLFWITALALQRSTAVPAVRRPGVSPGQAEHTPRRE